MKFTWPEVFGLPSSGLGPNLCQIRTPSPNSGVEITWRVWVWLPSLLAFQSDMWCLDRSQLLDGQQLSWLSTGFQEYGFCHCLYLNGCLWLLAVGLWIHLLSNELACLWKGTTFLFVAIPMKILHWWSLHQHPSDITGRVCLKYPANNTVTPSIRPSLPQIYFNVLLRASFISHCAFIPYSKHAISEHLCNVTLI